MGVGGGLGGMGGGDCVICLIMVFSKEKIFFWKDNKSIKSNVEYRGRAFLTVSL